ncbi:MAG: hypothetical protein ACE5JJ_04020 [Nitrospinota bacterium]
MSAEETRRMLKVFGVTVTDFEQEAARLQGRLKEISAWPPGERATLKDLCELLLDLSGKWLQVTQHLFQTQVGLLESLARAAGESPPK